MTGAVSPTIPGRSSQKGRAGDDTFKMQCKGTQAYHFFGKFGFNCEVQRCG
jgi:hypothetical protein